MRSSTRLFLAALATTIALCAMTGTSLAAPTNDNFADAQQLVDDRGTVEIGLDEATAEPAEPQTIGTDERTVWFRYTASADGFATFSLCSENDWQEVTSANLSLFTGASLNALDQLDDSSGGCPSEQPFNAAITRTPVAQGTEYYLQIGSTALAEVTTAKLTYDFNVAIPPNDDFDSASEITGPLPQTITADNGLATTQPDEPDLSSNGPRNSVWHTWTPEASGVVSIDTCSSIWVDTEHAIDSRLHVYTNTNDPADLAGVEHRADNDDGCAEPNSRLSHVYVEVTAGTPYWIRLANYAATHGHEYELTLRWVGAPESILPPRIFPESARLPAGETYLGYSYDWGADPAVTSVTYQWERCNSAGLECAAIDGATDENYNGQPADIGNRLRLSVTADNGVTSTTQHSAVSGLVESPPVNDNYGDATELGSSVPTSVVDDNFFATSEDGENNAALAPVDRSVWYHWTAPETKTYLVDTCESASASSSAINVYADAGLTVSELALVSAANTSCEGEENGVRTYFAATTGASYFIQAGSVLGVDPMEFTLAISEAPAPSFASGPTLSGSALENATLTLTSEPEAGPIPVSQAIVWELCDSAGANCSDLIDITGSEIELGAAMVGNRIRATVTYSNANGTVSESALSGVIEPDGDADGLSDANDGCDSHAQGAGKTNGCPLEGVSVGTSPSVAGTPEVGSTLTLSIGAASNTPGIDADVAAPASEISWYSCTTPDDESPCATRPGLITTYVPTASDIGRFIRAEIRWHNSDGAEAYVLSPAIAAVAAAPVVHPPTQDLPANPPAPTNPLSLTVKKSLGNLKPRKGVVTVKGAVVSCASSATGPCTGSVTFSYKDGKKTKKFASAKFSVATGKTSTVAFKLSSVKLRALKKAGKLKGTVSVTATGPGFAPSSATGSATLKP